MSARKVVKEQYMMVRFLFEYARLFGSQSRHGIVTAFG